MGDLIHDDVDRALAAYGGAEIHYRTFGTFSIHPQMPIVTHAASLETDDDLGVPDPADVPTFYADEAPAAPVVPPVGPAPGPAPLAAAIAPAPAEAPPVAYVPPPPPGYTPAYDPYHGRLPASAVPAVLRGAAPVPAPPVAVPSAAPPAPEPVDVSPVPAPVDVSPVPAPVDVSPVPALADVSPVPALAVALSVPEPAVVSPVPVLAAVPPPPSLPAYIPELAPAFAARPAPLPAAPLRQPNDMNIFQLAWRQAAVAAPEEDSPADAQGPAAREAPLPGAEDLFRRI